MQPAVWRQSRRGVLGGRLIDHSCIPQTSKDTRIDSCHEKIEERVNEGNHARETGEMHVKCAADDTKTFLPLQLRSSFNGRNKV